MKVWKTVMRRVLSVGLVMILLMTTLFFTDLGIELLPRANASITVGVSPNASSGTTITLEEEDYRFWVPECIYLSIPAQGSAATLSFGQYINDGNAYASTASPNQSRGLIRISNAPSSSTKHRINESAGIKVKVTSPYLNAAVLSTSAASLNITGKSNTLYSVNSGDNWLVSGEVQVRDPGMNESQSNIAMGGTSYIQWEFHYYHIGDNTERIAYAWTVIYRPYYTTSGTPAPLTNYAQGTINSNGNDVDAKLTIGGLTTTDGVSAWARYGLGLFKAKVEARIKAMGTDDDDEGESGGANADDVTRHGGRINMPSHWKSLRVMDTYDEIPNFYIRFYMKLGEGYKEAQQTDWKIGTNYVLNRSKSKSGYPRKTAAYYQYSSVAGEDYYVSLADATSPENFTIVDGATAELNAKLYWEDVFNSEHKDEVYLTYKNFIEMINKTDCRNALRKEQHYCRQPGSYNSTKFNNYLTAMRNAAIYAQSPTAADSTKLTALNNAVKNIGDMAGNATASYKSVRNVDGSFRQVAADEEPFQPGKSKVTLNPEIPAGYTLSTAKPDYQGVTGAYSQPQSSGTPVTVRKSNDNSNWTECTGTPTSAILTYDGGGKSDTAVYWQVYVQPNAIPVKYNTGAYGQVLNANGTVNKDVNTTITGYWFYYDDLVELGTKLSSKAQSWNAYSPISNLTPTISGYYIKGWKCEENGWTYPAVSDDGDTLSYTINNEFFDFDNTGRTIPASGLTFTAIWDTDVEVELTLHADEGVSNNSDWGEYKQFSVPKFKFGAAKADMKADEIPQIAKNNTNGTVIADTFYLRGKVGNEDYAYYTYNDDSREFESVQQWLVTDNGQPVKTADLDATWKNRQVTLTLNPNPKNGTAYWNNATVVQSAKLRYNEVPPEITGNNVIPQAGTGYSTSGFKGYETESGVLVYKVSEDQTKLVSALGDNTTFDYSVFGLTNDLTLYGRWGAKTYPIEYNWYAGSSTKNPTYGEKAHGTNTTIEGVNPDYRTKQITVIYDPCNGGQTVTERYNFTFSKWNTAAGGDGTNYTAAQTYSANAALKLYPVWTVNTAHTASDPGYTGHSFLGWYTGTKAANGTVTYGDTRYSTMNMTVGSDVSTVTLYAKWATAQSVVTLNPTAEATTTGTTQVTATYGSQMPAATMPTRDGYDFAGYWDRQGGVGKQYYGANGESVNAWDKESPNVTLYAYFTTGLLQITLDPDGATWSDGEVGKRTVRVEPNGTYTLPTDKLNTIEVNPFKLNAKAGYTYSGWLVKTANAGSVNGRIFTAGAVNAELCVDWQLNYYTVTIDPGDGGYWNADGQRAATVSCRRSVEHPEAILPTAGGDAISSVTNNSGVAVQTAVLQNDYDWATLAGWEKTAGTGQVGYNSTTNVWAYWIYETGDHTVPVTVRAIWDFNVTLDDQGGSGGSGTTTLRFNAKPTANVNVPTRTGYTFDGYFAYVDDGLTTQEIQIFDANGIPTNTNYNPSMGDTLYAQWTGLTYTVTLDANGGTASGTTTVTATYGSPLPTDGVRIPIRAGYVFDGYYANPADPNTQNLSYCYYKAENNAIVAERAWSQTSSATIYAHWIGQECSYLYNINGLDDTNGTLSGTGKWGRNWNKTTQSVTYGATGTDQGKDALKLPDAKDVGYYKKDGTQGDATVGVYFLIGWSTVSGATQPQFEPGQTVDWSQSAYLGTASEVTFYAVWSADYLAVAKAYDDIVKDSTADGVALSVLPLNGNTYCWGYLQNPYSSDNSAFTNSVIEVSIAYEEIFNALAAAGYCDNMATYELLDIYRNTAKDNQKLENMVTRLDSALNNLELKQEPQRLTMTGNYNSAEMQNMAFPYTVKLHPCGGRGGSEQTTVFVGQTMPTIEIPTREGYLFDGYYTSKDGIGTKYYDANGNGVRVWRSSSDKTILYANWVENPYAERTVHVGTTLGGTVQFFANGERLYLDDGFFTVPGGTVVTIKATPKSNYSGVEISLFDGEAMTTVTTTTYNMVVRTDMSVNVTFVKAANVTTTPKTDTAASATPPTEAPAAVEALPETPATVEALPEAPAAEDLPEDDGLIFTATFVEE